MGSRHKSPQKRKWILQEAINTERINLFMGYELIINEKQLQRLQKNYGDILRATKGSNELHSMVCSEW
jgi:hypothetical protein